jgi:hypothetical protein
MKGKGSFIVMTFSFVAVVLFVSMFLNIMTAIESIRSYAHIASFTALSTIVTIAPTVLLISGIFAAGWGYYKGYKGAAASDASGVMRMVFGIVSIILFASLFYAMLPSMYYLYDGGITTNATFQPSNYTAFQTVVGITPTVLFLGGIFGGVSNTVSGFRARRRSRRAMLA